MFPVCDIINFVVADAADIAGLQLKSAIAEIDEQFGPGYAKKHPQLVAAIVQAASRNLGGAMLTKAAGELLDCLRVIKHELECE